MARTIAIYAAVILVFLAIYFLAHFYIYTRFLKIFKINKIALVIALSVLAIIFPVMSFVVRKLQGTLVKSIYFASAAWPGTLFFLLIGFFIADLAILASGIDYKIPYYIVMAAVLAVSLFSLINATNLKVNEIGLEANVSQDLRLVQISDVHLGPINSKSYLQKIVDKSNSLNPDFVFITGDLFDGSTQASQEAISPLENLKSMYGVYFVTGNHETYIDEAKVLGLISFENVTILRNKVKEINGVQIIGADYPEKESEKGNSFLNNLSSLVDKKKFSILLYHPPAGFEKAADAGISLQLSGHTHNGQIFPFNLVSRIFYKYVSGLHKNKSSYLYVSQGAGTWGPAMRFGSSSEITLITLERKK